ncbi:MAG: acyl-CoA dehydratase activase [Armatimonadota bacterium]
MIVAGVDAGARAIKVVLLDPRSGAVVGRAIATQGTDPAARASALLTGALAERGLSRQELAALVATGYARGAMREASSTVTEITCHARGVRQLAPETRTVVEIGAQDSKVIWLDERGGVRDFAMNDRCAAGSGRFLEVLAARLQTDIAELGALAAGGRAPATINSTCAVFADNEVTGLLATGASPADIAAGVVRSLASRVGAMVGARAVPPVALTGGVALIPGISEALAEAIGVPVSIPPDPQFTGALGAALIATDEWAAGRGLGQARDCGRGPRGRPALARVEGSRHA